MSPLEEAERRIAEAARTRAAILDLSYLGLEALPESLGQLTGLTSINLIFCQSLKNVDGLKGLNGLTSLNLSDCRALTNVDGLKELKGLTSLNLSVCLALTNVDVLKELKGLTSLDLSGCGCCFEPIRSLLPQLASLILHNGDFPDLPAELCGNFNEDVLQRVRAHFAAIEDQGAADDAECKVLVLGNGGAGKSSLVRLLQGQPHRDDEPSTHAIHFAVLNEEIRLRDEDALTPTRLNVWDFGGQDLYHRTHRMFFQSGSVYLVAWDPHPARRPRHDPSGYYDILRPLQYWVDQIVAVDSEAQILIVRTKADLSDDPIDPDWRVELPDHQEAIQAGRIVMQKLSSRERKTRPAQRAIDELRSWLAGAVAVTVGDKAKRTVGKGRLAVKQAIRAKQATDEQLEPTIRAKQATHEQLKPSAASSGRVLDRAEFDKIVRKHCRESENTTEVLGWLHRTGVVFWKESLFGNRILVDQRWAIEGIYLLLDRSKAHPKLVTALGRFTRKNLAEWAWDAAGHDEDAQRLFLDFMQGCGLCFPLPATSSREKQFLAPEYLPLRTVPKIQKQLQTLRQRSPANPTASRVLRHRYLGEEVVLALMVRFGSASDYEAVLWKRGLAFRSANAPDTVAEATWTPEGGNEGSYGGTLSVTVCGAASIRLLDKVLDVLRRIPGVPQEVWRERPDEVESPEPTRQSIRTLCPKGCNLLYFAANPPDNSRLGQAEELNDIRNVLEGSKINLIDNPHTEPIELLPSIRKQTTHVVHFSGHGTADGGIELAGPPGSDRHEPCPPAALRSLFKGFAEVDEPPFLMVLSWCHSNAIAKELVQWVRFTVGFPGEPWDGHARKFASYFYQMLAYTCTIQTAYERACGSLESTAVKPVLHSMKGQNPGVVRLVDRV
jgi:internalin A